MGGNFIEANQVTSDLLGYEKSELLNMTLEDIHLPGYTKTINDMLDELKKADYYCFETEIVTKDYKLISVKICNKIIELNGESSILSIVSDVTERNWLKKNETPVNEIQFRSWKNLSSERIK